MFYQVIEPDCGKRELNVDAVKCGNVRLCYNDGPSLLKLLSSLYDKRAENLQMKLNIFLEETSSARVTFIVLKMPLTNEYSVQVIGRKILNPSLTYSVDDGFIKLILHGNDLTFTDPQCLDKLLFENISLVIDGEAITSVLAIPCCPPCQTTPLFFVCLVNSNQTDVSIDVDKALVRECFRYCSSMLRNTLNQQEFRAHHEKCKEIIETFEKVVPKTGISFRNNSLQWLFYYKHGIRSLELTSDLISAVKQETCKMLNVEICSIYVKETPYLVSRTINYGTPFDFENRDFLDIKIPLGVGLAGKTALSGQILSTNNAQEEKYDCNNMNLFSGTKIRNVMAFPMFGDENQVFGVIEVCNKIGKHIFTDNDKVYATCLSRIYTPIIRFSLDLRKIGSVHARRKLLAPHLIRHYLELDKTLPNIIKYTETTGFENIGKFSFLPSEIPESETVWTTVRIFFDIGAVEHFEVIKKRLFRFVMAVKRGNRPFPFHNWFHTFSTVQYMYSILKTLKLIKRGIIKELEAFALIMACLCHHFDFRGATNMFQATPGTVLASLYSSPGCLSKHHSITQILRLLIQPECDILSNMNHSDYRVFVILLDKLILATDMAEHVYSLPVLNETATKSYKKGDFHNKEPLFNLLMASAEMSDHARLWAHAQQAGERSVQEFYATKHFDLGKSVFKFPDIYNKTMKADLVIHFNEVISQPAFGLLADIFPPAAEFTKNLEESQKQWRIIKKHLKKIENFELYGEVESDESDEEDNKENQEDNDSD